ncbi:unnamed protein product, partial [Prorocentrum cordatum]
EFITINANSLGTLERVMMQVRYLVQTLAIMAQELQADEHRINLFVGRMEKLGWRLGIVPSVKKEGSWSGGVLVATRCRQGMDFARRGINSWDISPPASRGRLAVAWLDGVCKGGLLFGSAYLWTSEGLTRRNELILTKWASVVNATGYQWVLVGDFNMDPHVIRDSGLLCRMNGIIVHDRQQGSCTMLGQQYDRDYFIVSKSLVLGPLEATVQNGYNVSPHSPVVLRLARQHRDDRMVYVLQKPQRWPLELPMGCATLPTHWPRPLPRHGGHSQDVMDDHWRALGVAYEEHLNRFHNFEGEELTRRQGHYEQAIYKWTYTEAPRLKEASREQAWAEAAEWLSRRLRQLTNFVTRWWTSETDETRRQAIHVADTMLAHEIVMPLMRAAPEALAAAPPGGSLGGLQPATEEAAAGAAGDDPAGGAAPQRCPFAVGPQSEKGTAWEDEAASLVSENEDTSLPDLPCEEAEVVQSRLAAGALPRGGEQPGAEEQLTWDTVQWPAIVNTVGSIDVTSTGWKRWLRDHGAASAGAIHKWTKPHVPWQPTAPPQNENISEHALAHPQEAADHSLAGWEEEYRTPPITPKEVLDASDKFRAKTGLGESGWHPRLWKQGGVQGAARVASVLNAVEAGSPWPEPQSTILFYLLAKPAGGYRNLGLIPELARLWETIRFPFARRWEEANRRAYDWAAKGRSSERAAWVQALFCEATVGEGLEYAVTYFDLVRCFEYVTHELVWKAGSRWGFNRLILKVVLRIYAMVRRIVLDGCYTRGRRWARGIVAGSRFAPLCLKMVLYMELDGVVEAFPWADTCLFFDDLAMATHGVREFVQYWHSQLVQTLINMFEVVLDMRVSRGEGGKTVTLASTSALNAELGKRIRTHGVRMVKEEKHLGVTTAAGRYRRVGAFSKRAVKFAARRDRIARVRRAGGPAHKVIRHAKVPSLLYGVNVMGMADTKLGELRQSVATAMAGNAKGRSTYLTLLADDVDPGILANASPILAWAQTWQEAEDDPSLVPRLQVRGPAGAFVATVKRLGWMTQAAHSIAIGTNIIDLRTIPLHELHHYVRAATEQGLKDAWLAKGGSEFNVHSVFVEPVRALLRRPCRGRWTQAHQTRVRTLWCGGTWPQARLHAKGAAPDAICKACNQGEGTDRHRTFVCAARQEERRRVGGAHIVQRGANPWPGSEQLWGRGLANDPAVELGLWDIAVADTIHVEGDFAGFAAGRVYSDGSLLYGKYAALRRGGWSFVQLNEDMSLKYACYGPLPRPQWQQSIFLSELMAVLRVLEVACPPIIIVSDCQSVIDGFLRGPSWA